MNEPYEDVTLVCRDCLQQFVWTVGEQEWFAERALHQARRCPSCRHARKAERTDYRD
jgi:Probable zinc-ribbon domain